MSRFNTHQHPWLWICLAITLLWSTACGGSNKPVKTDPTKDGDKAAQTGPVEQPELEETKEESDVRIAGALEEVNEGNLDAAIAELEEVMADDPEAYFAAYNLGVLYDQKQDPDKAVEYYRKALEIDGNFAPALLNWVRLEARRDGDAIAMTQTYIDASPTNVGLRLARVEGLLLTGRSEEVIPATREVLKMDEANARARYYLAYAHFQAKRYPLSEYIIEQGLEIDSRDAESHFLRGLIKLELDNRVQARESFERAIELRGDYPEAQNARGLTLHRNRDFEGAEAAFRVALRYAPDHKEVYLNLGNTLKAMGRGDEAKEMYTKALELDPEWGDAYFAMGVLFLSVEGVPLKDFTTSDASRKERFNKAKEQFGEAKNKWSGKNEEIELAEQFIAKADRQLSLIIDPTPGPNAECDPEFEDCSGQPTAAPCDPDFEDCSDQPAAAPECDPDFEDCGDAAATPEAAPCDPDFEECGDAAADAPKEEAPKEEAAPCDPDFEECGDAAADAPKEEAPAATEEAPAEPPAEGPPAAPCDPDFEECPDDEK